MLLSFVRGATLLALTGCVAPVGVEGVSVPPDSAKICAKHCDGIGMRLSAVAIMANNVGCVCQPIEPAKAAEPAAPQARADEELQSANVMGMATVLMRSVEEQTRRARSSSN